MKIVCCIKQVPALEQLQFDAERGTVIRDGVELVINTFDRRSITEAVAIKQRLGAARVEVVVVTMGPPQAREALLECLAIGADRAVHLLDPAFAGSDTLATARALAATLRRERADLLFFGQYALDAETGQVGPEVAELLGLPCITNVRRIAFAPDLASVEVEYEIEDGHESVSAPLPALLTIIERLNRPARPTPDGLARAGQMTIEVLTPASLGAAAADFGLAGSPTWVAGLEIVKPQRPAEVVTGLTPQQAAARLADYLEASGAFEAQSAQEGGWELPDRSPDADRPAVWVLAELLGDGLRPVTVELLGKAQGLAAQLGGEVVAVMLEAAAPTVVAGLGAAGADRVLVAPVGGGQDTGGVRHGAALAALLERYQPAVVLAPSTLFGRAAAARAAARLGLGLTADCLDVQLDAEGRLVQFKPAFGGSVVARILTKTTPQVATLRPGVLPRPRSREGRLAVVEQVELPPLPADAVTVLRSDRKLGAGPRELEQAGVVIGVGTGIEGDWNLPMVRDLAAVLGAAVGGTRRSVDAGIMPGQQQIGLTGKHVAPRIYLALGVRGNLNHMIGVQRAGKIVAVNLDPEADIFRAADFGVVGDVLKIVPLLTEELRRRKAERQA